MVERVKSPSKGGGVPPDAVNARLAEAGKTSRISPPTRKWVPRNMQFSYVTSPRLAIKLEPEWLWRHRRHGQNPGCFAGGVYIDNPFSYPRMEGST